MCVLEWLRLPRSGLTELVNLSKIFYLGSRSGTILSLVTQWEGEKRWDTHFFGQLQHFMILWAIIEYCDLKVGNVSTSCFYAPRTRTDVPGDPSGPLYCVVFAVFGSRVFPHPFVFLPPPVRVVFMFTTQLILSHLVPT